MPGIVTMGTIIIEGKKLSNFEGRLKLQKEYIN